MKRKEFVKALHDETRNIHVSSELRQRTLDMVYRKEEKIVKKKLPVSVVAAVLVLLLGAVALAAASRMGLVDYYKQKFEIEIPENAVQNMQTDVATDANDLVSVHVREMYYDGMTAMAVVDVIPKLEHMLLIGVDNTMDDHCVNLFRNNEREGVTIRNYFLEQEYRAAYRVSVGVNTPEIEGHESMDFCLGEDGVMTYYCQTTFDGFMPEREAQLHLSIYQYAGADGKELEDITMDQIIRLNHPVTLKSAAQGENELYISDGPQKIEDVDIEIEEMRVLVTELELKVEIDYSCPELEEMRYIYLEAIDPESSETEPSFQRLKEGVEENGYAEVIEEGEERNRCRQHFTLSVDELHESYTLRAFNFATKERFGTATMTMRAATAEEQAAIAAQTGSD